MVTSHHGQMPLTPHHCALVFLTIPASHGKTEYGYGPPVCLLVLVFVVIGLIVLHFCGVLSLSVFVAGFITAVVGSCAKLVAAVAKEVLNDD
jgi:hypothetical protein